MDCGKRKLEISRGLQTAPADFASLNVAATPYKGRPSRGG
jgi:hypothetical protein